MLLLISLNFLLTLQKNHESGSSNAKVKGNEGFKMTMDEFGYNWSLREPKTIGDVKSAMLSDAG